MFLYKYDSLRIITIKRRSIKEATDLKIIADNTTIFCNDLIAYQKGNLLILGFTI